MMKKSVFTEGNRKLTVSRAIMTILTLATVVFIFSNSAQSAVESTQQSSPLTDAINSFLSSIHIPITVTENALRKLAHFTEYALFGAMLVTTVYIYVCKMPKKRSRTLSISLPVGAAVCVIDELIQLFPEGRSCEVRDMLIDFSGILLSALIIICVISAKEKRKQKTAPINESAEG